MSCILGCPKLDNALKGSQPVHGYCLHSLRDEKECMTCFATCTATVHHVTATGFNIASNYLVVPAPSMKMRIFVFARDCLHRPCESDQITSVNNREDEVLILLALRGI